VSLNKFTIQESFAISAGAGSGKTYTLSRRYINALLGFDYFRECYEIDTENDECTEVHQSFFEKHQDKKAKVNQIVTLTYTEAAALEMKGRIFALIAKVIDPNLPSNDDDYKSIKEANENIDSFAIEYVQTTLKQAFEESSNAKISTIHSFCLNIIKGNSDIARIDTKLDMIKDDEKAKELSNIIFEVLNDQKNEQLVLDISSDIGMFFINNLISKYVSNSKFRRDYDNFSVHSINIATYQALILELYPLLSQEEIDLVKDELANDTVRLDWFNKYYDGFLQFNAIPWSLVNAREKAPTLGAKKFPITDKAVKALDNKNKIESFMEIDHSKEKLFFDKIDKIKDLLKQISKYDKRLYALGKIDFDTIITRTLEIIPQIKTNFKYIMVDEFQDTNEIQFDIVKNAIKDGNLFVVGDSKQSIYSFQGAQLEVFNNAVEDKNLFESIVPMSQNFRSDSVVLENVNKIFAKLLKKEDTLKLISQNYEAAAQDLHTQKKGGSFEFLITSQVIDEKLNELDTITQFVADVANGKLPKYSHITNLIKEKKKAIAIIFDSSTKMLELKAKLKERGIVAKVSASDNFYHTKEINDIFNLLKAIDILSKKTSDFSDGEKFYLVAAMRSNLIKTADRDIKIHLDNGTIPEKLDHYKAKFSQLPLALFVKYVYDDANIFGVYAHFEDIEQRVANLYKFLNLCREYESSNESNLYKFLSLLENSIYFSEAKEDEAFYKSENSKSIEICSIHSTKGLAYPLVLLGNSDKGLYGQITSDSLKHNNFTLNGLNTEIVGFKINSYIPLSFRVLKQLDKMKHLAEKKRLLYVALTRAEHDIVISAHLPKTKTKEGSISLREDSYLHMIRDGLNIEKEKLFNEGLLYASNHKIEVVTEQTKEVEYIEHSFKPITFEAKKTLSATTNHTETKDEESAKRGTLTHKILELYWDKLENIDYALLYDKFNIEDDDKEKISQSIKKFIASDVYKHLKDGAKHRFELEFHFENKIGFIDLIYFDEQKGGWVIVDFKTGEPSKEKEAGYQKQLDFYEDVLRENGHTVVSKELLWV